MSNPFDTLLGANRGANTAAKVRPLRRGENVVVAKGHKLAGAVGVVKAVEGDIIGVMLRRATKMEVFEKGQLSRVERADQEAEYKLTEDVSAPAGSEKHKQKVMTPTLVTTDDGMMGFIFTDDDEATPEGDAAKAISLDDVEGESRLNTVNEDDATGDAPGAEAVEVEAVEVEASQADEIGGE